MNEDQLNILEFKVDTLLRKSKDRRSKNLRLRRISNQIEQISDINMRRKYLAYSDGRIADELSESALNKLEDRITAILSRQNPESNDEIMQISTECLLCDHGGLVYPLNPATEEVHKSL